MYFLFLLQRKMVKKTTMQKILKDNCDPRKYGQGIQSNVSKALRDLSQVRYNRYSIGDPEGGGRGSRNFHKRKFAKAASMANKSGFREAVSSYIRQVSNMIANVGNSYAPNVTSRIRQYLSIIDSWLLRGGYGIMGEAVAFSLINLIQDELNEYGRDSSFWQPIDRFYWNSGLYRWDYQIRTWGSRLGNTIRRWANSAYDVSINSLLRYLSSALRGVGSMLSNMGNRVNSVKEEREKSKLDQIVEDIQKEVETNPEYGVAKEVAGESKEKGQVDVYPDANTDTNRTDDQVNHIEETTNTDANHVVFADSPPANQTTTSDSNVDIWTLLPPAPSASATPSSNSDVDIWTLLNSGSEYEFFDPDTQLGNGYRGRCGGGLFTKKKNKKRSINEEQYDNYLKGIKKAKKNPISISVSGSNPFEEQRSLDQRFLQSVQVTQPQYDNRFVILDENTQPPADVYPSPTPLMVADHSYNQEEIPTFIIDENTQFPIDISRKDPYLPGFTLAEKKEDLQPKEPINELQVGFPVSNKEYSMVDFDFVKRVENLPITSVKVDPLPSPFQIDKVMNYDITYPTMNPTKEELPFQFSSEVDVSMEPTLTDTYNPMPPVDPFEVNKLYEYYTKDPFMKKIIEENQIKETPAPVQVDPPRVDPIEQGKKDIQVVQQILNTYRGTEKQCNLTEKVKDPEVIESFYGVCELDRNITESYKIASSSTATDSSSFPLVIYDPNKSIEQRVEDADCYGVVVREIVQNDTYIPSAKYMFWEDVYVNARWGMHKAGIFIGAVETFSVLFQKTLNWLDWLPMQHIDSLVSYGANHDYGDSTSANTVAIVSAVMDTAGSLIGFKSSNVTTRTVNMGIKLVREYDILDEDYDHLDTLFNDALDVNKEKEKESDQLQVDNTTKEKIIQEKESLINKLRNVIDDDRKLLDDFETKIRVLDTLNDGLYKELARLRINNSINLEALKKCEKEWEFLEVILSPTDMVKYLSYMKQYLTKQLDYYKEQSTQLEIEIEAATKENKRLKQDNEALTAKTQDQESTINRLTQDNEALTTKTQEQESVINQQSKKNEEANISLAEARSKITELETKIEALDKELKRAVFDNSIDMESLKNFDEDWPYLEKTLAPEYLVDYLLYLRKHLAEQLEYYKKSEKEWQDLAIEASMNNENLRVENENLKTENKQLQEKNIEEEYIKTKSNQLVYEGPVTHINNKEVDKSINLEYTPPQTHYEHNQNQLITLSGENGYNTYNFELLDEDYCMTQYGYFPNQETRSKGIEVIRVNKEQDFAIMPLDVYLYCLKTFRQLGYDFDILIDKNKIQETLYHQYKDSLEEYLDMNLELNKKLDENENVKLIEKLTDENDELSRKLKISEIEIAAVVDEHEKSKKEIKKLKEEIIDLEDKIDIINNNKVVLLKLNNDLNNSNVELLKKFEEIQKLNIDLKSENTQLKTTNEEQQSTINQLRNENQELEGKNIEQKFIIEQTKEENKELKEERKQSKERTTKLGKKFVAATKENRKLKNKTKQLNQDFNLALTTNSKSLTTTINNMEKSLLRKDDEIKKYKREFYAFLHPLEGIKYLSKKLLEKTIFKLMSKYDPSTGALIDLSNNLNGLARMLIRQFPGFSYTTMKGQTSFNDVDRNFKKTRLLTGVTFAVLMAGSFVNGLLNINSQAVTDMILEDTKRMKINRLNNAAMNKTDLPVNSTITDPIVREIANQVKDVEIQEDELDQELKKNQFDHLFRKPDIVPNEKADDYYAYWILWKRKGYEKKLIADIQEHKYADPYDTSFWYNDKANVGLNLMFYQNHVKDYLVKCINDGCTLYDDALVSKSTYNYQEMSEQYLERFNNTIEIVKNAHINYIQKSNAMKDIDTFKKQFDYYFVKHGFDLFFKDEGKQLLPWCSKDELIEIGAKLLTTLEDFNKNYLFSIAHSASIGGDEKGNYYRILISLFRDRDPNNIRDKAVLYKLYSILTYLHTIRVDQEKRKTFD